MKKTAALPRPVENYYITEHFMYNDFVCPCCDRLKIIPALYTHVRLLEEMRTLAEVAFEVTSGYRCESHNAAVKGAQRSWHLLFATDIRPENGGGEDMPGEDMLRELYRIALRLDFGGIGLYETHLHLDMRPEKVRWRG